MSMLRLRHSRLTAVAALLIGAATVLAACGGGDADSTPATDSPVTLITAQPSDQALRTGEPRPFAMGFLAVPATLSEEAYVEVFDTAAATGDLLMIQRNIPWAEVAPGATLSPQTEATIDRETALLSERNLDLLFAIDPWDPIARGRLTQDAPGTGFGDPAVVQAYLDYVRLIMDRYQPRWIALAVDVDQFAAARPDELEAFQAAYIQAYRLVKERSPDTLAFVTFQLEDLQALVPWGLPHDPQWGLILRFSAFLDLLAVSSFPSFIFPFQADIPDEYFSRLQAFNKPIAIVPTGYASQPGRGGVTFGTVSGQRAFVERLLEEAEDARWELVVWLAPQDPAFAAAAPYDLINDMGLRDTNGVDKPAWSAWAAVASRPWTPIARLIDDTTTLPIPQGGVPEPVAPAPQPTEDGDDSET